MKANEVPEKIFLEKEKETDRIHHLWSRTPVISSLYEHIEYTRTDAFIEKAAKWINEHTSLSEKLVIENFRKYMKGE